MNDHNLINKNLVYTTFLQRENEFKHHSYNQELLQYELLKSGDPKSVEESTKLFNSNLVGHLSDHPLRNYQYLFVASVTIATRSAMEAGLETEVSFNLSDLYIQTMDKLTSIKDISNLQKTMIEDFTNRVSNLKKEPAFSKPILLCLDYIYYHLHQKITIAELSDYVSLNASYLSVFFKKEVGTSVSDYIRQQRIKAASNMLRFSDYTYLEIANYLAFSNHSHFISIFKKETGYTPKQYRQKFYRHKI